MFRRRAWLIVLAALNGCCHAKAVAPTNAITGNVATPRPDDTLLASSLIAGDEERTLKLTHEVLDGSRVIAKTDLNDDRRIAPNILLRATYDDHDYQLGVNTVSEYALCVLQIKNRTSSENILRLVNPALQHACSTAKACEVCNAQAFPVRAEVKQQLVEYWILNTSLK